VAENVKRASSRSAARRGRQLRQANAVRDLGRRFARSKAMLRLVRAAGRTSPYTAIALTVPGGTLIALALWVLDRTASTAPLRRALHCSSGYRAHPAGVIDSS
jgi:hypothetical protein